MLTIPCARGLVGLRPLPGPLLLKKCSVSIESPQFNTQNIGRRFSVCPGQSTGSWQE